MLFQAQVAGQTWRVEVSRVGARYSVSLDGRALQIELGSDDGDFATLVVDGERHDLGVEPSGDGFRVHVPGHTLEVGLAEVSPVPAAADKRAAGPQRIVAPMPGRIVRVLVALGADVVAGQGLAVVEAMKMENELRAPRAGRVSEIAVHEGQVVEAGALVAMIT